MVYNAKVEGNKEVIFLKSRQGKEFHTSFEIENMRINISLQGGFFGLTGQSNLHRHNGFEIHIAHEGFSLLKTEVDTFPLAKFDGYIIPPNTFHRFVLEESQSVRTTFCFSFEKLHKSSEHDVYSIFHDIFYSIEGIEKINNTENLVPILKQMLSEFYSEGIFSQLRLNRYFTIFMLNIAESLSPENRTAADMDLLVERQDKSADDMRGFVMEEYINNYYNKNISVKDLSNVLHLSEKQTARVFEQHFGMSFKQFIIKFRLKAAIHLLCSTDLSINEIAKNVGYQTYNGFYRLFMTQTGISPEKYRDLHR